MASPKEFIALPGMSVNVRLDFSNLVKNAVSKLIIPIEAVFSPESEGLKTKIYRVWKVDNDTMQAKRTLAAGTYTGLAWTEGTTDGTLNLSVSDGNQDRTVILTKN